MNNIIVKTPSDINQLVECLKCAGEDTYLISGGTDFVIEMRNNPLLNGIIIDVKGIKELRRITYRRTLSFTITSYYDK